jgi:hypothetical protein
MRVPRVANNSAYIHHHVYIDRTYHTSTCVQEETEPKCLEDKCIQSEHHTTGRPPPSWCNRLYNHEIHPTTVHTHTHINSCMHACTLQSSLCHSTHPCTLSLSLSTLPSLTHIYSLSLSIARFSFSLCSRDCRRAHAAAYNNPARPSLACHTGSNQANTAQPTNKLLFSSSSSSSS